MKTLDDAIALVRNRIVKYAFSFDTTIATILQRDNLCDQLYPIPTAKKDSSGWYYGISIPPQLRQKIDQALGILVLKDLPRKAMESFGMSELNCRNLSGE